MKRDLDIQLKALGYSSRQVSTKQSGKTDFYIDVLIKDGTIDIKKVKTLANSHAVKSIDGLRGGNVIVSVTLSDGAKETLAAPYVDFLQQVADHMSKKDFFYAEDDFFRLACFEISEDLVQFCVEPSGGNIEKRETFEFYRHELSRPDHLFRRVGAAIALIE